MHCPLKRCGCELVHVGGFVDGVVWKDDGTDPRPQEVVECTGCRTQYYVWRHGPIVEVELYQGERPAWDDDPLGLLRKFQLEQAREARIALMRKNPFPALHGARTGA